MRLPPLLPVLLVAACGGSPEAPADASAPPDAAPPSGLAADLEAIRAAQGVPALAAAIATADEVLELVAVGTRHRDTDVAVTPGDRFHLGSDTKAMTATLVAMAVEDGLLAWDTTLAEALPAITTIHPDYADVPIDALLAHRAGAWTDLLDHLDVYLGLPDDEPLDVQRAIFAEAMLSEAPELPPGTAFGYSNAGYMVAGAILEAVYDRPWEQLIAERLFTPLAMGSCGFGAPGSEDALDEPWGHTGEAMTPVPPGPDADNLPVLGPAGTVHCALEDWAAFGALQLGSRPDLISAASLTRLHTSLGDSYGLGWIVASDPTLGRYIAHDGSNTLWYARIVVLLDDERVLLVASNAASSAAVAAVGEATDLLLLRD